jgi:hypothetical protein
MPSGFPQHLRADGIIGPQAVALLAITRWFLSNSPQET